MAPQCDSTASTRLPPRHTRLNGASGHWRVTRHYSSSGKENEGGEGKESEGGGDGEEDGSVKEEDFEESESLDLEMLPLIRHHAIAPVSIPDHFPEVPVLPISRNPLFPRFVKMLEVCAC